MDAQTHHKVVAAAWERCLQLAAERRNISMQATRKNEEAATLWRLSKESGRRLLKARGNRLWAEGPVLAGQMNLLASDEEIIGAETAEQVDAAEADMSIGRGVVGR